MSQTQKRRTKAQQAAELKKQEEEKSLKEQTMSEEKKDAVDQTEATEEKTEKVAQTEKADAEATEKIEEQAAELKKQEEEEENEDDMDILEAIAYTERTGKPVARRAWNKIDSKPELMFKLGETKPSYRMHGKHFSPYSPSIEDVLTKDWHSTEE